MPANNHKKKNSKKGFFKNKIILIMLLAAGVVSVYFITPTLFALKYEAPGLLVDSGVMKPKKILPPPVIHLKTPEPVRALYMTSWVAGTPTLRKPIVDIINETEANALVIDIKDYTGFVAFEVEDPEFKKNTIVDKRIPDIKEFIKSLHDKNIYVIGRIAVFQDPHMVKMYPELAVKRKSDGAIWKDYKGISWIDAGAEDQWKYIIALSKESYRLGFDEINYDYIRFPSDGNMKDISYPWSDGAIKSEVMEEFFSYLHDHLKGSGIVTSADLFGMTTTNQDDLNIGQVLEKALPYFDYIAPMVYPSHYPAGFIGLANPAAKPYEVVKYSMDKAFERSSTTPGKLRPWLQDFNLGATYTPEMIRLEKKAVYDAGITSWMMWSASNKYTVGGLDKDIKASE